MLGLREKTEDLLAKKRRQGWTYREIADRSHLSFGFIAKFGRGAPENPGIHSVEELYRTLTKLGQKH